MATNIYCEDPACSKNNRIAVFRTKTLDRIIPGELYIVDLNEGKSCLVDTDNDTSTSAAREHSASTRQR
ncbi:MAG: hypothetical protein ACPL3Q_02680, partial [Candidatus Ratteibacteria bacterium]